MFFTSSSSDLAKNLHHFNSIQFNSGLFCFVCWHVWQYLTDLDRDTWLIGMITTRIADMTDNFSSHPTFRIRSKSGRNVFQERNCSRSTHNYFQFFTPDLMYNLQMMFSSKLSWNSIILKWFSRLCFNMMKDLGIVCILFVRDNYDLENNIWFHWNQTDRDFLFSNMKSSIFTIQDYFKKSSSDFNHNLYASKSTVHSFRDMILAIGTQKM
jgi:hypothetical protein